MAPSSITIKIDFGAEGGSGSGSSVSLNGGVPTQSWRRIGRCRNRSVRRL